MNGYLEDLYAYRYLINEYMPLLVPLIVCHTCLVLAVSDHRSYIVESYPDRGLRSYLHRRNAHSLTDEDLLAFSATAYSH